MLCERCGAEGTDTHHVSYDPLIIKELCRSCHMSLHRRGKANFGGVHGPSSHTEETKEKISKALKGRHISEEWREKLRQANLGKTHSEAQNEKMRQSIRETWARKRESKGRD